MTTDTTAAQASDSTRNGVDTATLFATLDADSPSAADARVSLASLMGPG
jgi:hypothetical protein